MKQRWWKHTYTHTVVLPARVHLSRHSYFVLCRLLFRPRGRYFGAEFRFLFYSRQQGRWRRLLLLLLPLLRKNGAVIIVDQVGGRGGVGLSGHFLFAQNSLGSCYLKLLMSSYPKKQGIHVWGGIVYIRVFIILIFEKVEIKKMERRREKLAVAESWISPTLLFVLGLNAPSASFRDMGGKKRKAGGIWRGGASMDEVRGPLACATPFFPVSIKICMCTHWVSLWCAAATSLQFQAIHVYISKNAQTTTLEMWLDHLSPVPSNPPAYRSKRK